MSLCNDDCLCSNRNFCCMSTAAWGCSKNMHRWMLGLLNCKFRSASKSAFICWNSVLSPTERCRCTIDASPHFPSHIHDIIAESSVFNSHKGRTLNLTMWFTYVDSVICRCVLNTCLSVKMSPNVEKTRRQCPVLTFELVSYPTCPNHLFTNVQIWICCC